MLPGVLRPVPTSWQGASARMCDRGYLGDHGATAERPLGAGGIKRLSNVFHKMIDVADTNGYGTQIYIYGTNWHTGS